MAMTDSLPTGDAGGLTVVDERLILSGLIAKNAAGTPRVGVFPAGTGILVTGRASMGYDVAPFKAATSRTGTGVELLANDASVTVATTAAPGANSRIDVIWARPQFTANTDPTNVPILGVTQGTAAAVPTKPPIPDGALELAWAEVPSSATTTASVVITQSAPMTAASGGIVPVRNSTELTAYAAADGTLAVNMELGELSLRKAGAWQLHPAPRTVALTGFSANWNAVSGFAPELVIRGKTRTLYGAVNRLAGGALASILTIPTEHRPAKNTFLPGNTTDLGTSFALQVLTTGVLRVPYGGGSSAAAYPLFGTWEVA